MSIPLMPQLRLDDPVVKGRQLIDALAGWLEGQTVVESATRVEIIETHISWVLLAGEFAFKIKKPVNLGFLDFSTLQSRKFYCEEELRLNRRFAPQLYLAVVPITGVATDSRIGRNRAGDRICGQDGSVRSVGDFRFTDLERQTAAGDA